MCYPTVMPHDKLGAVSILLRLTLLLMARDRSSAVQGRCT